MSQLGSMSGNNGYNFGGSGQSQNQTQTPLTYGANYNINLQRYNATLAGYTAQAHQQALAAKQITGQYASGYAAQQNLLQSQWQSAIPNLQQQMISKGLGSSTVESGMQNQALQQQSFAENQLAGQYAQGLAGIEAQNQGDYQNVLGAQNQFMASQTAPIGQAVNTLGQTGGGQFGYQGGSAYQAPAFNQQSMLQPNAPGGYMGSTPSIGAMQGALGGYSGGGTGYGNGGGGSAAAYYGPSEGGNAYVGAGMPYNGPAQYSSGDSGSYYDDSGS